MTRSRLSWLSPRRELALVVLACVAGAAVVLYAATLTWAVEVVVRPAPLPDERQELTGASLAPYLPALGWAAVAGALALLATRGRWRQAVGVLLVGLGLGAAAGGYWAGSHSGTDTGWWPLLAVLGGLLVALPGVVVVVRGRSWPAMAARYERAGSPRPAGSPAGDRRDPEHEPRGRARRDSDQELWDALDRGEDPTA